MGLYLPRKFKIGIAVPPNNDVDVFSQDLGLIAILEEGKLVGFNIAVGGGMGMTYGDTETYPQLARVIGFCTPDQIIDVAEKIMTIQRDYGDRSVRKMLVSSTQLMLVDLSGLSMNSMKD